MTVLLASLLLGLPSQRPTPPPEWLRRSVVYAIRLERFENGNPRNDPPGSLDWAREPTASGSYGGDVEGVERRWPHVAALGAKAMALLTPVAPEAAKELDRLADRADVRLLALDPAAPVTTMPCNPEREAIWRAAVIGFARDPGSESARQALDSVAKVAASQWGLNMLSSPDGARLRTSVRGGRQAQRTAILLQFILPGTPVVLAGDETGMEGSSLRPMDWLEGRWDADLMKLYPRLIALRQGSPALLEGSMRLMLVGDEKSVLAVVRERGMERVILLANRSSQEQRVRLDRAWAGTSALSDLLGGSPVTSGRAPIAVVPPGGWALVGTG